MRSRLRSALKTTWAIKKKVFVDTFRRVGGTGGTAAATEDTSEKTHRRKDDDEEILFYHAMSDEWFMDFVSSGCYKAIIDLTPGDGGCAFAGLLTGVPVLAVTMNDVRTDVLFRHLVQRVLTAMVEPTSPAWLYESSLAELRADVGKPTTSSPAPAPPHPAPAPPAPLPHPAPATGQSTGSATKPLPAGGQQTMLDKLKQMLEEKKHQGKPS